MISLLKRNLIFFYTAFFCASTQNMVSQLFFDTYYAERKNTLLPLTLFLGSLAMLAGIRLSTGYFSGKNRDLIGVIFLAVGAFAIQMLTSSMAVYILAFLAASLAVGFLYNVFDNNIMDTLEKSEQSAHIRVLLLYQMLGYMLSPLFFSASMGNTVLCILVISLLGAVSYTFVLRERGTVPAPAEKNAGSPSLPGPRFSRSERLFLAYIASVFAAQYILLSITVYMFKDFLGFENYPVFSSIFLLIVVLVVSASIVLSGLKKTGNTGRLMAREQALFVGSMLLAVGWILARLSTGVLYLAVPCLLFGAGYGLFMNSTKAYANCSPNKDYLISAYNTAQTFASLAAYVLTFVVSLLAPLLNWQVIAADMGMICVLLAVSLVMLMLIRPSGSGVRQ